MANCDHLSTFREDVGLPPVAPKSVVAVVFASSRLSARWKDAIDCVYGRTRFAPDCTDRIDESRPGAGGIDVDLWRQMVADFDDSGLRNLDAKMLRESSDDMSHFFALLESNCFAPDALTAAKAYIAVYQKRWPDLLAHVLRNMRYDTRKEVQRFVDNHPTMNWNTLCTIFSGMASS